MKARPGTAVFPMLAHQGGWDEMLLVVGPLVLIGAALWLANRRVAAQLAAGRPHDGEGRPASEIPRSEGTGRDERADD
jgi:hypothetical protein